MGWGKWRAEGDVQRRDPDLLSLQRLPLSPRLAFLCHQRATPPPVSLLRAFCDSAGKLEMGLNRALGLGHLQTRRKPETGSVLHDLCAMIKSQSHCCSWGEILLDLDPHLRLHRPWVGGVWSWDAVPALGSAHPSLPQDACVRREVNGSPGEIYAMSPLASSKTLPSRACPLHSLSHLFP